jgi:hypothetical protein
VKSVVIERFKIREHLVNICVDQEWDGTTSSNLHYLIDGWERLELDWSDSPIDILFGYLDAVDGVLSVY